MRPFFRVRNLVYMLTSQARNFSNQNARSAVSQYFSRAKLIDSIRRCLRSGTPDKVSTLLDNPNLDSFVVSNALLSAPSAESALLFLEALKGVPHFVHTQQSLYAIAKVLAKAGRCARLKALIDAINDCRFHNVKPISLIESMKLYATAGSIGDILRVLGDIRSQGKPINIEVYNIVMGLYVRMGKDSEAVETFHKMMKVGAFHSTRTFTIVVEHLVKSGHVERAKGVFDVLPSMRMKHTTRQYAVLVEAFLYREQYDAVKSLLKQMKMEGQLPSKSLLNLLQPAVEAGYLEGIDDFGEEMGPGDQIKQIEAVENDVNDEKEEDVDESISGSDIGPIKLKPWLDPSALASALGYWRVDDVSALEAAKIIWTNRLVCKMIRYIKSPQTTLHFFCWVTNQPEFVHDVHTYSAVITKLSSEGRVDLVDDILLKIKDEGIKLPFRTLKQVIDFYGISKEGDAALKVFHDAEALCGPVNEFDIVILYSSLVKALLKCGMDHVSVDVVKQMFSHGIHPDSQTFSGLMYHFAGKGDNNTVQKLFGLFKRTGVLSDADTYKALIRAYCKCEKVTIALRFLKHMVNSGLKPDSETKLLLVKCLCKEGLLKEASSIQVKCKGTNDTHSLPSPSQLFNIKSGDLLHIQKIYCDSYQVQRRPMNIRGPVLKVKVKPQDTRI